MSFNNLTIFAKKLYDPLTSVISVFFLRKCYFKIKEIKDENKNLSYCKVSIYILYMTYVNLFTLLAKNGLEMIDIYYICDKC